MNKIFISLFIVLLIASCKSKEERALDKLEKWKPEPWMDSIGENRWHDSIKLNLDLNPSTKENK